MLYGPRTDAALGAFARGRVSAEAGRAAYDAIIHAVDDAQAHVIDAIATAPINKEAFAAAGLPWRGHTELLAHLTGAPRVAMMFYADALRVVLATVHIPLARVPRALTRETLEGTIALAARELPRFGIASPRLAARRAQPARRGARPDRSRRGRGARAGGRGLPRARDRRRRTVPGRHDLRPRDAW